MYVRTKKGEIFDCYESEQMHKPIYYPKKSKTNGYIDYEDVYKKSDNLIDILQVGDYVNGYKVTYVANVEPCPSGKFVDIDCDKDSSDSYFFDNEIKTIVTKEQFESMEYKLGE